MDVKSLEGGEGVQELFEIAVTPESADSVIEDLRRSSYVSDVEVIAPRNGRLYGSAKVLGRPICRAFIESKCFLLSAKSLPNSTVEWRIQGAGEALKDLIKRLEAEGAQIQVKEISNLNDDRFLTPRQEQILEIAMDKGFFEFPRRITLRDLAAEVGVKPATLSELLRRAQKRALTDYLRNMRRTTNIKA